MIVGMGTFEKRLTVASMRETFGVVPQPCPCGQCKGEVLIVVSPETDDSLVLRVPVASVPAFVAQLETAAAQLRGEALQ